MSIKIGIPSNTRIREQVYPVLDAALDLYQVDYCYRTDKVPEVKFVELRISDLIGLLRNDLLDVAIMGDDTGLEEVTGNRPDTDGRIKRIFGMQTPSPAKFNFLTRKENERDFCRELFEDYFPRGYFTSVTSYPNLLRERLKRLETAKPKGRLNSVIKEVNGKVESYLRNGVYPDVQFAYDLVQTGQTAQKFNLSQIPDPLNLEALPSFWCAEFANTGLAQNLRIEDSMQRISELIAKVIPIDQRSAEEILGA